MPQHPIAVKNGEVSPSDYARNVGILADLETIRVNQFEILQDFVQQAGSLDTTSEKLQFDRFDPGYVYIITNIVAIEVGTGTPQIKIGATIGSTDYIFESATVSNAEDSVEYIGQLMLKEGDKVYATFEGATAADTAQVFLNGYRIRR